MSYPEDMKIKTYDEHMATLSYDDKVADTSYQEAMDQLFPAKMNAAAESADSRLPFHVAYRFQNASKSYHDPALTESKLATFIEAKRREQFDAPQVESHTIYRPIARVSEIRVLELLPATFDQPISGSLHHVSVDFESGGRWTNVAVSVKEAAMMAYTALSYVWGSSVLACGISIDGRPLGITQSLDTAIRHLRHHERSVMLWIDQICINQNDLEEKKTQVLLMSLIYQRAWNTVIWLGDTPADEAFDALQVLASMTHDIYNPLLDEEKERLCNPPYMEAGAFEAVETLFASPWFQRTWTIQEAVLTNELWVMSGTSVRHWEDSVGLCTGTRGLGLFVAPNDTRNMDTAVSAGSDIASRRLHGSQAALVIWQIKQHNLSFAVKLPLLDALVFTRHTQATNPLDNVYGLLGLSRNDVVPDYTMQATELYRRMALQILRSDIQEPEETFETSIKGTIMTGTRKPYRFLYCVDHPVNEFDDSPSWVVDWSKPRVTSCIADSTSVFNCFHAGQSSIVNAAVQISEDESMLCLTAKVFDTVERLSPIITDAGLDATSLSTDNSALKTCIAFATSPPPDTATKSSFLGFCKVVTAGKDIFGREKYPVAYTEILSLLCDIVTGRSPTFADQVYTPRQQKGRLTLDNLKTRKPGRTFQDLREAFQSAVLNRRLCWTKSGHLGIVPRFARQGDCVAVVPGSPVPWVIRQAGYRDGRSLHQFIGESYIDGIMHGEVMVDDQMALTAVCLV